MTLEELLERVSRLEQRLEARTKVTDIPIATGESVPGNANEPLADELRNLEKEISALRSDVKDETIKVISDVNRTLVGKQFALPQVLLTVLSMTFVLLFGYQVFKVDEIHKITVDAQHSALALREGARAQADVLGQLVQALTDTTQGYYQLSRDQFMRAVEAAKSAETLLDNASTRIDRMDEDHPAEDRRSDGTQNLAAVDLVGPLRRSLGDASMLARSLQAQSQWKLHNYEAVWLIGDRMVREFPDRWEGYHFRGGAALESPGLGGAPAKDLRLSVTLKPANNPDALNLIEHAFLHGDFQAAKEDASRLWKGDPYAPETWRTICEFFLVTSEYILGNSQNAAEQLDKFINGETLRNASFKRDYSCDGLARFLQSEDGLGKVINSKQQKVRDAVGAVLSRC